MSLTEIVEEVSVVGFLSKNGYTLVRSIHTEGGEVKYLKAYDERGMIVYIYVDVRDEIIFDDGERDQFIVKQFTGKSLVPASASRSILEKNPEASGLAYECSDELCILIRKNDTTIENPVFRVFDPIRTNSIVSLDGGLSGYPLVRLSEIILDPEGSRIRARELCEFIHEESKRLIRSESKKLSDNLSELLAINNSFVKMSIGVCQAINDEKKEICGKLDTVECPIQRTNLKRNVFIREDSRDKILKLQKEIFGMNHHIKKLVNHFINGQKLLDVMWEKFGNQGDDIVIYNLEDSEDILRM